MTVEFGRIMNVTINYKPRTASVMLNNIPPSAPASWKKLKVQQGII
jgi:hypothetical protein